VLDREDPPVLWALLWEPVLEVPVGGKAVMRDQLAHLLKRSESTDIAIRVVPKSVGAQPGMDGAFQIMTIEIGDIAYVHAPGGGRLVSTAKRSVPMAYATIAPDSRLCPKVRRETGLCRPWRKCDESSRVAEEQPK
jgi:hypothetical protein